jgi:hypothetical protein
VVRLVVAAAGETNVTASRHASMAATNRRTVRVCVTPLSSRLT